MGGRPALRTILKGYTFVAIVVLSFVCFGMVLARDIQTHHAKYPFLFFNLALAWLPLIVSLSSVLTLNLKSRRFRMMLLVLQGVAWILLYPNDSYLLTDFVHVFANPRYDTYPFGNMYLWYDLVLFFLYSLCGLLLGYQSLRFIHYVLQRKLSSFLCWGFIAVISYIVALGVFLGRMGRLNSWDIVLDLRSVVKPLFTNLALSSFQFIGFFGSFLLFMYLLFYLLTKTKTESN